MNYWKTKHSKAYECPKCGAEALVDRGVGNNQHPVPQFICFSCGSHWLKEEMEYCPECNQLRLSDEFEELIICRSSVGFYVCRSCYEKIFK